MFLSEKSVDEMKRLIKEIREFEEGFSKKLELFECKQVEIFTQMEKSIKKNKIYECSEYLQRLSKMWDLVDKTYWQFELSDLEAI